MIMMSFERIESTETKLEVDQSTTKAIFAKGKKRTKERRRWANARAGVGGLPTSVILWATKTKHHQSSLTPDKRQELPESNKQLPRCLHVPPKILGLQPKS